jgi:DNA invertase Pin-like site-specific DNA recombinase
MQNLGAKEIDDLRLRTDIDRRPKRHRSQVAALRKHGAGKVFREVASGAKTDRARLRPLLDQLDAGDVLMVTWLDRLARSTRDLLNTLAAMTDKKSGFRSLGDTWADTTTAHGGG